MKCFNQVKESQIKRIERRLKEVFDTDAIEYYGKNRQRTGYYTFMVKTEKINRKIQYAWATLFPDASSYSISKLPDGNYLSLLVEVSEADMKK